MKGYIVIAGILAVIVLSLVTLNVFFQRTLQMEMAESFNREQLLLANTEALNIQGYVGSLKNEVIDIAQLAATHQMSREADFRPLADMVFKGIRNVKKRIDFLDHQGKALFTGGEQDIEAPRGSDFVGRAEEVCPGGALIKQDTKRVHIAAPVCRSGSPVDVVVVTLDIQDIARVFLASIISGSRGYAWMMDETGNLLYHPTEPDMVGRNLYRTDSSCFKCHKTFDVEKKILEGKGDYFGRYVAPTGEDKILAFSTASVGEARWIVAVSSPYSEVTMPIKRSMKLYSWIIILIFAVTGIVSAMMIVLNRKREKAEERAKHEKELERYAEELELKVDSRTNELSEEKEKLNTIVSAMGSGLLLVDIRDRIQWINETMKEIAGRDITGVTCEEICNDCAVISSYEEGDMKTEIMSNLFGRSDGYFQITTAPVKGADGSLHAYIKLVQDVTKMKRMEEQMAHSEKLASLERLTSGIAQEIGNPLTSVFSFIELLEGMEHDELKKETLETIYYYMSRIEDTLKQLSGFSKMLPIELKPCKVNSILEDSLSLIQYDQRAQDITIMKDLQPDMPAVTTDGNQLSQVIVNIVLNAADAMPNGGTLTIQSGVKDNTVVIAIEDTGVGIDKENLGRIFDPFYTTKEKGTGLGLAVSHSIIQKLGGSLKVESELNRGSRFTIVLPMNGTGKK